MLWNKWTLKFSSNLGWLWHFLFKLWKSPEFNFKAQAFHLNLHTHSNIHKNKFKNVLPLISLISSLTSICIFFFLQRLFMYFLQHFLNLYAPEYLYIFLHYMWNYVLWWRVDGWKSFLYRTESNSKIFCPNLLSLLW